MTFKTHTSKQSKQGFWGALVGCFLVFFSRVERVWGGQGLALRGFFGSFFCPQMALKSIFSSKHRNSQCKKDRVKFEDDWHWRCRKIMVFKIDAFTTNYQEKPSKILTKNNIALSPFRYLDLQMRKGTREEHHSKWIHDTILITD